MTTMLPLCLSAASTPGVGDKAPDFALKTLDDQSVRLGNLSSNGPVVLVVLRGWPGYQCPICTAQVRDYAASAQAFAGAKATVLMVYPGPSESLKAHAQDFLKNKQWPKDFIFVTDPDYSMVNAYGLRWAAKGETAYPSTFVIDQKGTVRFAKVSHSHGNRAAATEALTGLKNLGN
jgi:peroxiredoxin